MDATQRKEAAIIVVATLFSLLFFLLLSFAFKGQTQTLAVPLIIALVGIIWISLIAIFMAFVINYRPLQWALLILPALMALISSGFSAVALIGSLLLFLALLGAGRSIRQELENRLKFATISIFRPGVRLLLLGVAAFALALALPVIKNQAQTGLITLPADTAATFVQPLTPLISQSIPNYHPAMTIDQIIQNQINRQQIPAGFELPPDQLQRSRQEIGDRVNLTLSGTETIPQIISQVTNRYIQNLAQGEGLVVTLVLVLLALIAIRALIPLIIWPILFLIMGLIFLAHRTHILKKVPTQVTVEQYQL